MSICCSRLFVKPLFDKIKRDDHFEPYKILGKQLKIPFYSEEVKKGKLTDDIFLKYLMCRPNMRMHIYKTEQEFLSIVLDVSYYKHLELNQHEYDNLILQLRSIRTNLNEIQTEKNTTHHLHIYFTEDRLENFVDPERDLDYVHGSKTFIETVINAKTLLNALSIKYLKHQNMKKVATYHSSIKKLNKFLHWMYKNMSLLDMELFIIWSGMVSFMLGVREFTDIDFHHIENHKGILRKLEQFEATGLVDMDLTDPRKINYSVRLQGDSMKLVGCDRNCMFVDPRMYSYFYGVKINNLVTHFYWRMLRGRPAQIAELIAMSKVVDVPVPKPILPKVKYFTTRYQIKKEEERKTKKKVRSDFDDDVSEEISREIVQERLDYYMTQFEYIYFMEELTRLKVKDHPFNIVPLDKQSFLNTIKMYLKRKYKISMSKSEIERILDTDGLKSISELKQFLIKNKNHYI